MYALTSCEMHKLRKDWMTEGDKPLTAAGNLMRPSIPLFIGWMKIMWEHIPEEMVHKPFLKCGISNKMYGTEDDVPNEDFLGGMCCQN